MISVGIEVNQFALINLISEAKFGNDLSVFLRVICNFLFFGQDI